MTSLRFRKRSEYYCPAERLKGSGDELFIVHTLSSTDGLTETCAQKRLFFSLPLFIVLCISRYRNRSGLKRDKRDRKSNKNMYMKYFAVMLCLGNLNVGNYVINTQWQEGRTELFPTNTTVRPALSESWQVLLRLNETCRTFVSQVLFQKCCCNENCGALHD